jgi:hypothetical protein
MINYSTVHALDLIFAQIYKIALIPKRREKYKETKEGYIGFLLRWEKLISSTRVTLIIYSIVSIKDKTIHYNE